ncbi:MAG TPA: CinA family protein [Coxiellaceae bacterium]|nr:CinA family protein [Coxiellaceae bacterium]
MDEGRGMISPHFQLADSLGQACRVRGDQLVTAESCTGGGLAQAITTVPGSSQWFDRGFVTYSDASKIELLKVHAALINQYGAVSREVALAMVEGALSASHATVSLGVTGIAGPTGATDHKPVGLVWFAIGIRQLTLEARRHYFQGTREEIRAAAIQFALRWAVSLLAG